MTGITKYASDTGIEVELTPQIVRDQLVQGNGRVTDQEVAYFLSLCKAQGLNPFIKDAYLIKYGDRSPAQVITSKTVFERRADQREEYDGMQSGVTFVNSAGDVERRDGTLIVEGETLVGGWARVYRKDRTHPTYKEVALSEYIGRKSDGTINNMWSTKPGTMIAKVAESQALRLAFPQSFQGLYTSEEMDAATNPPIDVTESVQEIVEPERYEHDYAPLTVLKNKYKALTGEDDKGAAETLARVGAGGRRFDELTPEEFSQSLEKIDAHIQELAEPTSGTDEWDPNSEEIPF